MVRKKQNKAAILLALFPILILICCFLCVKPLNAEKDKLVIVLDPGHGGSDIGAITKGRMEKELNFRVAMACKKELQKYEGVEVYLTRDKDEEISLADRAIVAKEYSADLLISLHFNASESHTLSGAETYVSSKAPLRQKAEKFALTELALLEQYGVPIHGNFTRLNDNNDDYYGIIREASSRRIPTVIVEHCYLDVPAEEKFYDTPDDLERFGKIDATAIAMTYGLKSAVLGVDYSDVKKSEQVLPRHIYKEDTTPPSVECKFESYRNENNRAVFRVCATDEDSAVVAYAVSKDGGNNFSPKRSLYFEDEFSIEHIIKEQNATEFVVAVFNAYDAVAYSEPIDLKGLLFANSVEATLVSDLTEDELLQEEEPFNEEIIPVVNNNCSTNSQHAILFWVTACLGILQTAAIAFISLRKRNR